ncbi:hypothetical protein [Streptomyces sp. NPDC056192]|uniref:hypothetical protein n=1 Tax=Streptomyces sp. NPDC056192 TaxID=3345743 RepID=UPI0035DB4951
MAVAVMPATSKPLAIRIPIMVALLILVFGDRDGCPLPGFEFGKAGRRRIGTVEAGDLAVRVIRRSVAVDATTPQATAYGLFAPFDVASPTLRQPVSVATPRPGQLPVLRQGGPHRIATPTLVPRPACLPVG